MRNRVPVEREARPDVPDFDPVPRKYRHDGWTPERQKAFIEALADTGSVSRAAAMVNMAQANCYTLRRAAGAESFRRAWEAALDFGVQRLKDIAFDRAIDGELVPVFSGGRLIGYRRIYNDKLLMFCLRHYGQDSEGRRTTIDYFSTRTEAGAVANAGQAEGKAGGAAATAHASTTTMRTIVKGGAAGPEARCAREDALAEELRAFSGVTLDAEVMAMLQERLLRHAEAWRATDEDARKGGVTGFDAKIALGEDAFVPVPKDSLQHAGQLEATHLPLETEERRFGETETGWRLTGDDIPEGYRAAMAFAARKAAERARLEGAGQGDAGNPGTEEAACKALPRPARRRRAGKG